MKIGYRGLRFITAAIISTWALLLATTNVQSARLTGAMVFSANGAGSPAGNFVWDTRGSISDFYKIFMAGGAPNGTPDGLTAPFLNGPTWALAPIDIPLTEGTHQFTVIFQHNGDWPLFALNLFLDGAPVAQISVKGLTRTNEMVPAFFSPNTAPLTYSMTSFPSPNAPASGTATAATADGLIVRLAEYYVAGASVFGVDRVGTHNTGANGRLDYVGTFTLEVRRGPRILSPPESQTVDVGDDVTFRVVAEGPGTLTYQWLKNGSEIPGATGTELTLQDVQLSDEGDYSVRVSNEAGSVVAGPARLTVTPPSTGTGIRLTAVFEFSTEEDGDLAGNLVWDTRGSESDFYKAWLTPGVPGGSPDGLSGGFINGPSWAQAPINIPLEEGTNRFTTIMQNVKDWPHFGINLFFQTSSVARISAKAPTRTGDSIPPFTANSSPLTYSMTSFPSPDAPASGRLRAAYGDFVVELTEYYVADDNLFNLDRVSSHSTLANGTLDFVGTFTLVVRRETVVPVSITSHPQSQTVEAGGTAVFQVTAEGTGPLSYQWLKNGAPISGATSAQLTLNNVQAADAGQYSVRVSNDAGPVTSNPATLTVTFPPERGVRLTAVFEYSTDRDGNLDGDLVWDTRGSESDFYKAWLTRGTPEGNPDGLTGSFVNGPSWAMAPINITLAEGTYRFTTIMQNVKDWPDFGINLFFQNSDIAQISAKAPTRTGHPIPRFTANSAPLTYSMNSFPSPNAPAAGTTRAIIGDFVVELTEFYVADDNLFDIDRVASHSTGANGALDSVGTFTVVVRRAVPHLTGLFVFSSNEGGSPAGNFVWDARGLESDFYKAFLSEGTPDDNPGGLRNPFINGPTWAQAPISIPLDVGTHEFTMFFQHNGDWHHFALNLCFGGSAVAQISAKGPARTGSDIPPFTANSAPFTYSMTSFPTPNAPASGTTQAIIGDKVVELTEYYVAVAPLFNEDRVGTHNVGKNGRIDYVGTFTLVVRERLSTIELSPKLVLPGQPNPFVIACNGETAAVTFQAPDKDLVAFAWFLNGSVDPFSTDRSALARVGLGTHTVTLHASDGTQRLEASLTFEVITPAEAVAAIIDLLGSSELSRKELRPLLAALQSALEAAESGDLRKATGQLAAFQNKVEAQLGRSHPDLARALSAAAQAVIDALDCDEG